MESDDLLCSRNARPPKALARDMAHLGVPVGGWVRKLRAVEDHSAPSLKREQASKLGGRRGAARCPFARRTRTIRMCSFDARSEGQPGPLPWRNVENQEVLDRPRRGEPTKFSPLGRPRSFRVMSYERRLIESRRDFLPGRAYPSWQRWREGE